MIYHRAKIIFPLLLLVSITLSCCGQKPTKKSTTDNLAKDWDKTIPGNFSGQSKITFDSLQIKFFIKRFPDLKAQEDKIRKFYALRKYAYAWYDHGQMIEQAGNLSNRVLNLKNDGIYQTVPYAQLLDSLFSEDKNNSKPDVTLEIMLTAQYFVFSSLAWEGMDKTVSTDARWFLPRKKVAYDQYLDSLLKEPSKQFSEDEPVYRQYELLRKYLAKYRKLDAEGIWPTIETPKAPFKPGDTSIVLASIKRRLFKLEDFKGDTLSRTFDTNFQTALKYFQERHGLTIDGLPNKSTMTELNVPIISRIKQILVNMERSRWLPVRLNTDYVSVNIPEFKLHVYHADSLLWSCSAVVGKTVHPTTVFYGEIKYVVFSPYWNVPDAIVRNEIIPGIKRNTGYLNDHHMEIIGRHGDLPAVRQKPGPDNSLGLVKFLFPNSYNIYLHDTPSKSLFGETKRAFSHGCIRIEEPAKLADFLLKDKAVWGMEKI